MPVREGADEAARRTALDAHVARLLGWPLPARGEATTVKTEDGSDAPARLLRRAPVGDIVHIFSHIRMTLAVEHARVALAPGASLPQERAAAPGKGIPETKWVDAATMVEERVSSSVAKCWRLVASGGGSTSTAAKRAAPVAAPAAGQGSIKKFFSAVKKE